MAEINRLGYRRQMIYQPLDGFVRAGRRARLAVSPVR
jgi:hypothetical protein